MTKGSQLASTAVIDLGPHSEGETIYKRLMARIAASLDPRDVRMRPEEAAAYIPMDKGQLAQLRYTGNGPKFLKPSTRTVFYRKGDIDDWLDASEQSTTAHEVNA